MLSVYKNTIQCTAQLGPIFYVFPAKSLSLCSCYVFVLSLAQVPWILEKCHGHFSFSALPWCHAIYQGLPCKRLSILHGNSPSIPSRHVRTVLSSFLVANCGPLCPSLFCVPASVAADKLNSLGKNMSSSQCGHWSVSHTPTGLALFLWQTLYCQIYSTMICSCLHHDMGLLEPFMFIVPREHQRCNCLWGRGH